MDITLLRQYLANKASSAKTTITESLVGRNLAAQIDSLQSQGSVKKMADIVADVHLQVKERAASDSQNRNFRVHNRLIHNLEELLQMLDTNRVDPSEIEILQDQITKDLKAL